MEIKYITRIHKFEMSNAISIKTNEIVSLSYEDSNTSIKQLFEKVTEDKKDELIDGFFIMEVESIIDETSDNSHNFYFVNTNEKGNVEYISIIDDNNSNNLDKEMLIDAIVGCDPSPIIGVISNKLMFISNTRGEGWKWNYDIKVRLSTLSSDKLLEIYRKLKTKS